MYKKEIGVNNITMKYKDIYYYRDELKDEFSGVNRKTITVDGNYRYSHGCLWKATSWVLYRLIMTPVAFAYMKLHFSLRIIGREKLKGHGGEGYFLYGNHTQMPGDGYMPTCITFPKRDVVVVHPDNVSLPGTRTFMEMIGALPIPNRVSGMGAFLREMQHSLNKGRCVVIYPEAHIWPYYTGIRPFTESSFRYPVLYNRPVFCFTVTYQERKKSPLRLMRRKEREPMITVYVDGPFYPDVHENERQAAKILRNQVYEAMVRRSAHSDCEKIRYVRIETKNR